MANENTNYTESQEQRILESIPFDFDTAKLLAAEFGKKPMSVVAKVKRMEADARRQAEADDSDLPLEGGAWYVKKPAYVTKQGKPVVKKADRVRNIAKMLGLDGDMLVDAWATLRAIEEVEAAIVLILRPSTPIVSDDS